MTYDIVVCATDRRLRTRRVGNPSAADRVAVESDETRGFFEGHANEREDGVSGGRFGLVGFYM